MTKVRIVEDTHAHCGEAWGDAAPGPDARERDHRVRELTQLALSNVPGCDSLFAYAEANRTRYRDLAEVVDQLLVPAVRLLGQMWCDDDADFVSVTLASHRISLTLMRLEEGEDVRAPETSGPVGERPVLLINAPDDQHGFGLLVIGFHLRRAGWPVEMAENPAALFRRLRQGRVAAVGISAAHDSSLAGAARLIGELRRRAPGGAVPVALGGAAITNGEEHQIGDVADLTTGDPAALLNWLARTAADGASAPAAACADAAAQRTPDRH